MEIKINITKIFTWYTYMLFYIIVIIIFTSYIGLSKSIVLYPLTILHNIPLIMIFEGTIRIFSFIKLLSNLIEQTVLYLITFHIGFITKLFETIYTYFC